MQLGVELSPPVIHHSKTCSKCGEIKLALDFYKDTSRKDGLYPACKKCHNTRTEAYATKTKLVKKTLIKQTCKLCKIEKSVSEFTARPSSASGYLSFCKPCRNKKMRVGHYTRTYGLDIDTAKTLAIDRTSTCKICGTLAKVVVDHCHTTEKTRGLLCYSCNTLLGMAKDDKDVLLKAIKYLEEYK
jgi:hypothetical protein